MDHLPASGEAIQKGLRGSTERLTKYGNVVLHGCVDWAGTTCKKPTAQETRGAQMMNKETENGRVQGDKPRCPMVYSNEKKNK